MARPWYRCGHKQTRKTMNEILSFIILCAAGVLCFAFFRKCADWFENI